MYYFVLIITIITAVLCVLYTTLIAGHCYGWIKTKTTIVSKGNSISVAIIIAARNEEQTISKCLGAVLAQDYPASQFRIFVVNDHSGDQTAAVVSGYAKLHANIQLVNLPEGLSGKKNAIAEAIKQTTAELIVTTDADCTMDRSWLHTIVSFYAETKAQMIAGPVSFTGERTFFEKMQSLELMALIGSTAGSLYFNKAVMCNGANLAYSREAFDAVQGFRGIDGSASGDDVLLMYKISEKYPGGIKFLKNREAIVYTAAKASVGEFISQRKRWASKGFKALNAETQRVSLLVYFFSLFLFLSLVITGVASVNSTVCQPFLNICLILTGIKCIIDFLLLFLAASFFKRKNYLYLFLPEQFIYVLYVVVVGLLGTMKKYEWKGRNY